MPTQAQDATPDLREHHRRLAREREYAALLERLDRGDTDLEQDLEARLAEVDRGLDDVQRDLPIFTERKRLLDLLASKEERQQRAVDAADNLAEEIRRNAQTIVKSEARLNESRANESQARQEAEEAAAAAEALASAPPSWLGASLESVRQRAATLEQTQQGREARGEGRATDDETIALEHSLQARIADLERVAAGSTGEVWPAPPFEAA